MIAQPETRVLDFEGRPILSAMLRRGSPRLGQCYRNGRTAPWVQSSTT